MEKIIQAVKGNKWFTIAAILILLATGTLSVDEAREIITSMLGM